MPFLVDQVTPAQTLDHVAMGYTYDTLVPTVVRLELRWGVAPRDLDSHLWLPEERPYHVYYPSKGSLAEFPFAQLDVDITTGESPENIKIARRLAGRYVYAVHNYSGETDFASSGASVTVFDERGRAVSTIGNPQGSGRWWHVVDIDGSSGRLTWVNQVQDVPPAPMIAADLVKE